MLDNALNQLKTVMIVDDDKCLRNLISVYLKHAGFSSVEASDGKEALGVMASTDKVPDLILTDILMPGMDGRELLAQLQRTPEMREIPVIVLSGLEEARLTPERATVQGYLKKPIQLDELSSLIEKCLSLFKLPTVV